MYSFTSTVRYSEVGEEGLLTPMALVNYLQDCSLFQTEHLGCGLAHVQEVGLRWLLAAWHIEIDSLPHYAQDIVVSTWATGFKGYFAGRNFTIDAADGQRLVCADSQWFMMSDATGRPIRPPQTELDPYAGDLANDKPLDMGPMQRKIVYQGDYVATTPVYVSHAYIDTNHHVNNAQYVNVALAALAEAEATEGGTASTPRIPSRLDVQYVRAARLGDILYPRVYREESSHVVALTDEQGESFAAMRAY